MARKIYDLVKEVLEEKEEARNSDRMLHFLVWRKQGLLDADENGFLYITYFNYQKAASTETIRRARQKLQERHEQLRPTSEKVKKLRRKKQATKGTFIYREE